MMMMIIIIIMILITRRNPSYILLLLLLIHSSFLEMTLPWILHVLKAAPPTDWCEDYEYSSYK